MATWLSDLISFSVYCFIIFIVYKIILMSIKRIEKKNQGTISSINALRILLRFVMVFVIIILIFSTLTISSTVMVSLTSISGIIIGFASSEIITQIIAGIYIISSRPFSVDDLIKISGIEGLVVEINLNHTVLKQFDGTNVLIPNKKILDAKITNFSIKVKDEIEVQEKLVESEEAIIKNRSFKNILKIDKVKTLLGDLGNFTNYEEITQYVFDIELELNRDPEIIFQKINSVCEDLSQYYAAKPKFAVLDFGYRIKIQFHVFAKKAQTIMDNQNNFINTLAKLIFSEAGK